MLDGLEDINPRGGPRETKSESGVQKKKGFDS